MKKKYLLKDFKDICKKCPKRDSCTELCEKVEEYVNQDYVPRLGDRVLYNTRDVEENWVKEQWSDIIPNFEDSEILKQIILELHGDGYSEREIAEYVPCSNIYVHQVIAAAK